ncbi:MAG: hypothetical protein RL701_8120 [Pseudomonadota bacterium]
MSLRLALARASDSLTAVEQAMARHDVVEPIQTCVAAHRAAFAAFIGAVEDLRQLLTSAQHRLFGRSSEKSQRRSPREPTLTEATDVLEALFQFLEPHGDAVRPTANNERHAAAEEVTVPGTSSEQPEAPRNPADLSSSVDRSSPAELSSTEDPPTPTAHPQMPIESLPCQVIVDCGVTGRFIDAIDSGETATAAANEAQEAKTRAYWRGSWLGSVPIEVKKPPVVSGPCVACGGPTRCIGTNTTTTEVLRWIPGRLVRRQVVRCSCVCAGSCPVFTISPWPTEVSQPLIERSLPDETVVAKILVDHARFAMPVYRQREMMRDGECSIPYTTMLRWRAIGSELLVPVYLALHRLAQKSEFVQIDDTRLMALVQSEKADGKHTLAGRMWSATDNQTFVYCVYATHWKASTLDEIIGEFTGVLLGDGYAGYARFCEENRLGLAGCNEHARRKFCDAALVNDEVAQEIVADFSKIYEVERIAKRDHIVGEDLVKLREREAKPIFERLHTRLSALHAAPALNGALRRAVTYFLNQYSRLTLYLGNARVPIGNNDLERLIRKIAMLRKASLFVGSVESGKLLAINLSIVLSCELCKICPYEYLCDVLPKLAGTEFPARRIDELLPHRWAQLRGMRPEVSDLAT